jgi:TatD DNase family protein
MNSRKLFNLHTHNGSTPVQEECIQLIQWNNEQQDSSSFFSIGLHPLDPSNEIKSDYAIQLAYHSGFIAIGEIGLDNRQSNYFFQEKRYIEHLKLANLLRKPIILHCVNAWDRCRYLHEQFASNVPLIYHGFSKISILERVLSYKQSFVSFGERLFFDSALQEKFQDVPLNRIFFETDTSTKSIQEIYSLAFTLRTESPDLIFSQIATNVKNVFGLDLDHFV